MLGRTNRRAFMAALGFAGAWPLVPQAQQLGKIPRVGVLWHAANEQQEGPFLGAFRQGLSDLGYAEGKNIELLNRFADEHYDRFGPFAAELVEAKVDVIVAIITAAVFAAKKATTTIPIVFVGIPDPVALHVVDSLAHPGGNLTGVSSMFTELTEKHLEILSDCLPGLSSAALLVNPKSPIAHLVVEDAQRASRAKSMKLSTAEAGNPGELKRAFSEIALQKPGAVIIGVDSMLYNESSQIADLAIKYGLPTIAHIPQQAEAGLLLSYGPKLTELNRRSAFYVDKILKGAKPSDLPVERPTIFNLVLNAKTARAIGITVPGSFEARADKVIE